MALLSFIGLITFFPALFALCVFAKLYVFVQISRLRSIARVPGPRLAKWSRLWIAKALSSGRSHEIWTEVNEKYGSVARIGPNHVLINDPDTIRHILAARSGYVRGPWFDSVRIDPQIPNIVSERNVEKHRKIRSKLVPSFTGKSVAAMEPVMDQVLLGWIDSLRSRFASTEQTSSIDIAQKIQFLTVDIITKICLGDEIGCIKNDCDMHAILKTVETGNEACQYFSVFLELNTLLFQLAKIPVLRRALFPKPSDSGGVGRLMGIIHEVVEKRSTEGYQKDMVSSLLKEDMSKAQVDSELVIALVAGSDTTSTSVQSTLLHIITNPRVYETLRAELRQAVTLGHVSNPIRDAEAKQLPYLQACVLEGLRIFPPLSQLRERVVPPGGDTLGRFHLPEGTFVGLNAWGAQFNKEAYGDDAKLFVPERWLTDDTDRLRAMIRTHSLVFGHGSTKCLGMSMAMMEIPKVIFELLRNFDMSVDNPQKPWLSKCHGIFFQRDFNVNLRSVDYTQPPAYKQAIDADDTVNSINAEPAPVYIRGI